MFIWDFVASTILEQIMDWVYKQIIGFLASWSRARNAGWNTRPAEQM